LNEEILVHEVLRKELSNGIAILCVVVAIIGGISSGMKPVVLPYLFSAVDVRISEYGVLESISMIVSSFLLLKLARVPGKALGLIAVVMSFTSWLLFTLMIKHEL